MALKQQQYHKTVLINEVLEYLNPQAGKTYVDATFGGGGHTQAILEAADCTVVAFDWDRTALDKNAPPFEEKWGKRFIPIWGNFAQLEKLLEKNKIRSIDGILADFGTSQYQIHQREGFSFAQDTPLDMRMSPAHHYFKASDIVNRYTENALIKIFKEYGEEPHARKIARAIIEQRKKKPFTHTLQLATLVEQIIPRFKRNIHPATKVFQALRIYVNKELENIEHFLPAALEVVNPGGRIVAISFHSLEDRIVKTFFNTHKDLLTILTKKPVIAGDEEVALNASSRSAKLRAAQKK